MVESLTLNHAMLVRSALGPCRVLRSCGVMDRTWPSEGQSPSSILGWSFLATTPSPSASLVAHLVASQEPGARSIVSRHCYFYCPFFSTFTSPTLLRFLSITISLILRTGTLFPWRRWHRYAEHSRKVYLIYFEECVRLAPSPRSYGLSGYGTGL